MNPMTSLLNMVIIRETWVKDALCAEVGGDDHFPEKGHVDTVRRALDSGYLGIHG